MRGGAALSILVETSYEAACSLVPSETLTYLKRAFSIAIGDAWG